MAALDFEKLVEDFYMPLYRFALSLSRSESDAADLTQQTFFLWASKGHQLHEQSKVKTWLFTTLYREFLWGERKRRRQLEFLVDVVAHRHVPPRLEVGRVEDHAGRDVHRPRGGDADGGDTKGILKPNADRSPCGKGAI